MDFEPQTAFESETTSSSEAVLVHWESYRASLLRRWWCRRVRMAVVSGAAEVMDMKICNGIDLVGAVLLAGFSAILLHPLVYGELGNSIMALMTPVR